MLRFGQLERAKAFEALVNEYEVPAFADARICHMYQLEANWNLEYHRKREACIRFIPSNRYLPTPNEENCHVLKGASYLLTNFSRSLVSQCLLLLSK